MQYLSASSKIISMTAPLSTCFIISTAQMISQKMSPPRSLIMKPNKDIEKLDLQTTFQNFVPINVDTTSKSDVMGTTYTSSLEPDLTFVMEFVNF
jgi:hypothetical protein